MILWCQIASAFCNWANQFSINTGAAFAALCTSNSLNSCRQAIKNGDRLSNTVTYKNFRNTLFQKDFLKEVREPRV